jgi:sRNA-binding protein
LATVTSHGAGGDGDLEQGVGHAQRLTRRARQGERDAVRHHVLGEGLRMVEDLVCVSASNIDPFRRPILTPRDSEICNDISDILALWGEVNLAGRLGVKQRADSQELTIEVLRERFPLAFTDPKPFKIGIADDLVATGVLSEGELRAALVAWCDSRAYQATIAAGGVSVDLDGEAAGEVADEASRWAALMMAAIDHGEPNPRKAAKAGWKAASRARKAMECMDAEKATLAQEKPLHAAPATSGKVSGGKAAGKPKRKIELRLSCGRTDRVLAWRDCGRRRRRAAPERERKSPVLRNEVDSCA